MTTAQLKENGICTHCRKRKAEKGKLSCSTCLEESREKRRKWGKAGLCNSCGMNPPPDGRKVCLSCCNRRKETSKKKKVLGICQKCTRPLMPNSNSYCKRHWFRSIAETSLGSMKKEAGEFLEKILLSQKYRCPYTNKLLVPGINCWLDHILPRSRFPELRSCLENVQWVDKTVNLAKGSMTHEEFVVFCHLVAETTKKQKLSSTQGEEICCGIVNADAER